MCEENEKKYNDIIKQDNVLKNDDEIGDSLLAGNDDNFNLVSDNCDNINEIENNIKKKIEEEINKSNEIAKIYDFNEILKTL